jgi:predicted O-methyltransferase YrrM
MLPRLFQSRRESIVDSLSTGRVAKILQQLHVDAAAADRELMTRIMGEVKASGSTLEEVATRMLTAERGDYRARYQRMSENFLAVSAAYGRFLYSLARARNATRIVEFGTSMGVSAIYLAAALWDHGGGQLIGTELEPRKVVRARANLDAAGLSDLVDIREGDALETLKDVGGAVDLLLIDGAWSLYLPVLKLIEPHLRPGAVVLAENAFDQGFRDYVRDPANGYLSQQLEIDGGRSNEFAVRTA